MPCISYEKITLSLTCFVANSFFMLMVAERIPTSAAKCPIISRNFFSVLFEANLNFKNKIKSCLSNNGNEFLRCECILFRYSSESL